MSKENLLKKVMQQYLNHSHPHANQTLVDFTTMESYVLGVKEIDSQIIPKSSLKKFIDDDFISVDIISCQTDLGKSLMGIELWDYHRKSLAFVGIYIDDE